MMTVPQDVTHDYVLTLDEPSGEAPLPTAARSRPIGGWRSMRSTALRTSSMPAHHGRRIHACRAVNFPTTALRRS
jgi:hypothetical protein